MGFGISTDTRLRASGKLQPLPVGTSLKRSTRSIVWPNCRSPAVTCTNNDGEAAEDLCGGAIWHLDVQAHAWCVHDIWWVTNARQVGNEWAMSGQYLSTPPEFKILIVLKCKSKVYSKYHISVALKCKSKYVFWGLFKREIKYIISPASKLYSKFKILVCLFLISKCHVLYVIFCQ
jgi:hypothetical protein